ncbi:MAG: NF038122 family metalloprotease [Akkermansiaceae bacterium]
MNILARIIIAASLTGTVSHALDINLNAASGMSQDSIDAFEIAAQYWEGVLTDSAVVNIDIDFTTLNPGVLGSAGSTTQSIAVSSFFAALALDSSSPSDDTAVANLPALSGVGGMDFRTQIFDGSSMVMGLDDNDSGNNLFLDLNTANAKALGLFSGYEAGVDSDASITFNDAFSWDYDNRDGVGAGLQDFVGVAIHEIGHSLGFVSGVDTMDAVIDNPQSVQNFRVFSGLDVFRYSADGVLDLSVGTASYFSIDGGTTALAAFSTGSSNGDGQQASHWKDNLGIGIMDPTAQPAGNVNVVTDLDLQAFDVIGWDLAQVPEPTSVVFLALGACSVVWRRSR